MLLLLLLLLVAAGLWIPSIPVPMEPCQFLVFCVCLLFFFINVSFP
jgi:hypothetical protein